MERFFESIYLLLDGLYGESLRNYMSGYVCASGSYTGANVYVEIGIVTAIIALVISIVYYKIIDPVEGKLVKWFIALISNAIIAGCSAYYWVERAESRGLIGDCLLKDDEGNFLIGTMDYIGFAMSNAIIAIIWFVFLGFIIKYLSINNRYIPF